jgi:phosphonoacetate hydrolase
MTASPANMVDELRLPQPSTRPARPAGPPVPVRVEDLLGTPHPDARAMGPRQAGDQGITAREEPYAGRVIEQLLRTPEVHAVASWRDGAYELRSATGLLRWQRLENPDGSQAFALLERQGDGVVASVDPRVLATLEAERAAAGGPGRGVPAHAQSHPDVLRRVSQLFDSRDAPDLVWLADPAHMRHGRPEGGGGTHGDLGIVQSRAPLFIAGPGLARGEVREVPGAGLRDVAPTIAHLLGVAPLEGAGAGAIRLRGQSGRSLAGELAAGAGAAALEGAARQALLVVWDGVNPSVLQDELARGTLPNLARLAGRGVTLRHGAIAEYPTKTAPNHVTLQTGAEPGRHGVVANTWYDRERRRVHGPVNSGKPLAMFGNGSLISPDVETLHEAADRSFGPRTRTAAINVPSSRGADIATMAPAGMPKALLRLPSAAAHMSELARRAPDDSAHAESPGWIKARRLDRAGAALAATVLGQRTPPRFTMLEQFLSDNMSHRLGPQSDVVRMALRVQDANLGLMLDRLEQTGQLDHTLVVLTSDHGAEHQQPGKRGIGPALRASGVQAVTPGNFVYLRTLDVQREPAAGGDATRVQVFDDDPAPSGGRMPIADAQVLARHADGSELTLRTGRDGQVLVPVPADQLVDLSVRHDEYTAWTSADHIRR